MEDDQIKNLLILGIGLAYLAKRQRSSVKQAELDRALETRREMLQILNDVVIAKRLMQEHGLTAEEAVNFLSMARKLAEQRVGSRWLGDYRLQEKGRWDQFREGFLGGRIRKTMIILSLIFFIVVLAI